MNTSWLTVSSVKQGVKRLVRNCVGGSAPSLVELANHRNARGELDFVESMLPWIDRPDADIDRYVRSVRSLPREYDLREKLHHWHRDGYVIFEKAADPRLIDVFLGDFEELYRNNAKYSVLVEHNQRKGLTPIRELTAQELQHPLMRVTEFHNASVAGKKLMLNSTVASFIRHLFGIQVVGMQSLTFRRGSEQGLHQDYAYVVAASNPSHLAASWIALENTHPDAGPLGFYPGSHRIRKFDFGNGLFYTPESKYGPKDFETHIKAECQRLGLVEKSFLGKKGDILLWHAALAHQGLPTKNRSLTRLSFVCHFSSSRGYPRDRRNLALRPTKHYYNGAVVYGDPANPQSEDVFQAGAAA